MFYRELLHALKKWQLVVPILCTALIAYLYSFLHIAQGVDDLCRTVYTTGGTVIGEGRIFGYTTMMLLGRDGVETPLQACAGVLLMCLGAVAACVLFRRGIAYAVGNEDAEKALPLSCLSVFCCMLISFPLNADAWVYADTGFMNRLSYLLIPLSLLHIDEALCERHKTANLFAAFGLATYSFGMFEASVPVYICYSAAYLFFREGPSILTDNKHMQLSARNRKSFLLGSVLQVGVMIASIVCCKGLAAFAIKVFSIPKWIQPSQSIHWLDASISIPQRLLYLCQGVFIRYLLPGVFSLPFFLLLFGWFFTLFAMTVMLLRREYRAVIALFVAAISPFLLSVLAGGILPYRTALGAAPCAGFLWLTLLGCLHKKKIIVFKAMICFTCGLIAFSALQMRRLFMIDYASFTEGLDDLRGVHAMLKDGTWDVQNKPIVYVGTYYPHRGIDKEDEWLLQVGRENYMYKRIFDRLTFLPEYIEFYALPNGVFGWACVAEREFAEHEPQQEMHRFLALAGCDDLLWPTQEQIDDADHQPRPPAFPDEGCITDHGTYLLVNIG